MAKFYGVIGYGETVENPAGSGKHVLQITERAYRGEVLRASRQSQPGDQLHDDLSVSNRISIVADTYANDNLFAMKYIMWRGTRWKITNIEDEDRPRLVLTLGEVWNGATPPPPSTP